ncbi:MAG TPA: UbiX family flavin prenyltransferase [Leucothrix sp.]|nr:UbiX family flavin prenyltransferase [Leucothrix sp.]
MNIKTVTLIMTGASGAQYGLRLLEELVKADISISLLLSRPAQIVINMETDLQLPSRASEVQSFFTERYNAKPEQIKVYEKEQWMAPIASGSGVADVTVVCPCTTGTLSAIAVGSSKSLLERAADVAIKERKKLILVVRETPLSDIHLENMLKLSRMGVVIMPANPGFYHQPKTLDDIVDFMVARILEHIGIQHELLPSWGS